MGNIQSHKELHVWQEAMDGAMEFYEITIAFQSGCRELDAVVKRRERDGIRQESDEKRRVVVERSTQSKLRRS